MDGTRMTAILWGLVALVGAAGWGVLALSRGETVSAAWLVARRRGHLSRRLPLLQPLPRRPRLRPRRPPCHAGRAAGQRPRLRADHALGAVRPPLRGHRRRGAAGGTGAGGAVRLPARNHLDRLRRGAGRRGAGLRDPLRLHPAGREVARPDGAGGDRPAHRLPRDGGGARHHDHPARGAGAHRGQRARATARGACSPSSAPSPSRS